MAGLRHAVEQILAKLREIFSKGGIKILSELELYGD
jgi:hypothetical protein